MAASTMVASRWLPPSPAGMLPGTVAFMGTTAIFAGSGTVALAGAATLAGSGLVTTASAGADTASGVSSGVDEGFSV